ncbi:MAG: hypothetical protein V4530_06285 [Pseudomonadota bacterium]
MAQPARQLPFIPATLSRVDALAYTGVAPATLRAYEARGIVRFLPVGPHRRDMAPREQLDAMVRKIWELQGALPPSEDFDFGDD